MIFHDDHQGYDAWLASRKGCITGSRFKDARDRLADKPEKPAKLDKKTGEILAPAVSAKRGEPSAKMLGYAYDVARERCGGSAPGAFVNKAMQFGTEQEPLARLAYEALTGNYVEEVGFITDDSGIFGLSPDGLIDRDGVLEIKTMVSSDTLFTAVADGDISAYLDQCNGYLWMLGRQWVDLVLWAPDLEPMGLHMTVRRIHRDEQAIQALEDDLLAFAVLVQNNEAKLRRLAAKKPDDAGEVLQLLEPTPEVALAAPEAVALSTFEAPVRVVACSAAPPVAHATVQVQAVAPESEPKEAIAQAAQAQVAIKSVAPELPQPVEPQAAAPVGDIVDAEVKPGETLTLAGTSVVIPLIRNATAEASAPTLRLGQIGARLGFALTADNLRMLGFEPAGRGKAAVLYRDADFTLICAALVKHINQVQAQLAA